MRRLTAGLLVCGMLDGDKVPYYTMYPPIPQVALFKRLVDATEGMAAALDDPDILCTLFARTCVCVCARVAL